MLEVHVDLPHHPDMPLTTVGVGHELKAWRAAALAEHIMDWVPDFALRPGERDDLEPGRVMEKLRRAYQATFGDGHPHGVPAEILLHAICRELYGSSTVIHKILFKTADNDTYKGFDGVHCVHTGRNDLELWFGEAKFYSDVKSALRALAKDLDGHLQANYVKNEFAVVGSKVDPGHPHAEQLEQLLAPGQTIEAIFKKLVVPAFVTYDSPATAAAEHTDAAYLEALQAEAVNAGNYLRRRIDDDTARRRAAGDPIVDLPIELRLFLLPMADKELLESELARRLSSWRR